jgi:uncharacterized protein (UPF0335 family)
MASTDKMEKAPDSNVAGILRGYIERVENLNTEIKQLNDDKRDVFAEAKGNGFDVKALKEIVKIRGQDANERAERDTIVETYMQALGML